MKLRVKGNSVRFRLTRSEVARLNSDGTVKEVSQFGPGEVLTYGIEAAGGSDTVRASFHSGSVRVVVPTDRIRQWASSDEVGIYHDSGPIQVAIEKDFRCLTRPEERFNPDVYPHPAVDLEEYRGDRDP